MQFKVRKMHFARIGYQESEKAFVRHYPKNLVSLGQMVLITVFIDLTPIRSLFGVSEHLNMMRMIGSYWCPILLEKFEYHRTNGQSKAGISNLETPAHY